MGVGICQWLFDLTLDKFKFGPWSHFVGHNNDVEINNGFCPTIIDQQASLFFVTMKNNCTSACMLSHLLTKTSFLI